MEQRLLVPASGVGVVVLPNNFGTFEEERATEPPPHDWGKNFTDYAFYSEFFLQCILESFGLGCVVDCSESRNMIGHR